MKLSLHPTGKRKTPSSLLLLHDMFFLLFVLSSFVESTTTTTTTTTTTITTKGRSSSNWTRRAASPASSAAISLPSRTTVAFGIAPSSGSASKSSSHGNSNSPCPPPERLRRLLEKEMDGTRQTDNKNLPILLPCCYDGLTARLVARAGFDATFMTGFGVSGVNGYPDTQLVSYGEMLTSAMSVAEGLSSAALEMGSEPIPCIADGDTGYGNAINVKRTVFGYGRAGMAGLMIEDQVAPKRCGHVAGKSVVSFQEAVQRVKAACDARDEFEFQFGKGTGPLVLARTDSLVTHGFEDSIQRCLAFRKVGCDMTFLEAPQTIEQMREYCDRVSGPKLANMLEYGTTPILPPAELKLMGYTMAAYPLTLLSASVKAMQESLDLIKSGKPTDHMILTFAETKDAVGFTRYGEEEHRYKVD